MKRLMNYLTLMLCFLLFFAGTTKKADQYKVQLAILLDTSGSMDGLIDQAKAQLWQIVNELATSKKDGQTIALEVALYEYGKDDIPASEGYLRMIVPLTTDLDRISEELFKLKTNGGSEYCGQVINSAVNDLMWSGSNEDLKLIFIAGNEEFTQGTFDYKKACSAAISNGIIVNTIFCGDFDEGVNTMWKDGAELADGKYMNIDHNQQLVDVETPFDDELIDLGNELNETYIPYGVEGEEMKERQAAQDDNSATMGSNSMVQRTVTKTKSQYTNEMWDLVDAEKKGVVDVKEVAEEELPENMQKMTVEEREAYVEEMMEKRAEIQDKINKLNEKRDKFVAEKRKDLNEKTLDQVIIEAIREQAVERNFSFEK